jgi:hypothetical protein
VLRHTCPIILRVFLLRQQGLLQSKRQVQMPQPLALHMAVLVSLFCLCLSLSVSVCLCLSLSVSPSLSVSVCLSHVSFATDHPPSSYLHKSVLNLDHTSITMHCHNHRLAICDNWRQKPSQRKRERPKERPKERDQESTCTCVDTCIWQVDILYTRVHGLRNRGREEGWGCVRACERYQFDYHPIAVPTNCHPADTVPSQIL